MPSGTLQANKVRFQQGQKYPVYQGPGEKYGRSGNGKASVSTNDWIQVFGEENGWLMIQYDITSSRMRIGWIKPEMIPQGASIQPLSFMPVQTAVTRSSSITDDPLFSKSAIASVSEGAMVQWLGSMGEYAYIEFYASGFPLRGFILASSLTMISSDSQESAVAAPMTPPAAEQSCTVNNPNPEDRLHLRSRPSTQAKSLGKYYNGVQAIVLTEEKNGWVTGSHWQPDGLYAGKVSQLWSGGCLCYSNSSHPKYPRNRAQSAHRAKHILSIFGFIPEQHPCCSLGAYGYLVPCNDDGWKDGIYASFRL